MKAMLITCLTWEADLVYDIWTCQCSSRCCLEKKVVEVSIMNIHGTSLLISGRIIEVVGVNDEHWLEEHALGDPVVCPTDQK